MNFKEVKNRFELWIKLINEKGFKEVAEVGVYKGDFAFQMLTNCQLGTYHLIDPWRNLSDWNKPFNVDDHTFEGIYAEAMLKLKAFNKQYNVLRGRTTEVSQMIKDHSLDFVYIDGDHTLKGISIDLIQMWPKVSNSGGIGGDDLHPSIWHHSKTFDPTFVFPFAIYFAEAVAKSVYILPHNQFFIDKSSEKFSVINLSNNPEYENTGVLHQLSEFSSQNLANKRYLKKILNVFKSKKSN